MTDENQEVELHDDVADEVVEAHDPKDAEAASVAAADKADDGIKAAPKRKGDNTKQDPMPKTKSAMMASAVAIMQNMNKEKLTGVLAGLSDDTLPSSLPGEQIAEAEEKTDELANVQYDFSGDLNALVEGEATLSEEFKEKASVIFEAAIKSKLSEEINRLESKYNEELAEEIEETKAGLVDKVDSYLNYVVEGWMEDNKVAIQNGLRTEIAENFMNNLKGLFEESYITVPEDKVDLVDELAESVDELEGKLNESTDKVISMTEELDNLKRERVISESSKGLADTEVEKLKSLVEDMDFEDEESFAKKVATVKESYFKKAAAPKTEPLEAEVVDEAPAADATGTMAQYINALKKTN